jgi:hypothetical protein
MKNNLSADMSVRVAVVIPCYKVSAHILAVIQNN